MLGKYFVCSMRIRGLIKFAFGWSFIKFTRSKAFVMYYFSSDEVDAFFYIPVFDFMIVGNTQ